MIVEVFFGSIMLIFVACVLSRETFEREIKKEGSFGFGFGFEGIKLNSGIKIVTDSTELLGVIFRPDL
jgi:hypothetical protein